jgi:hypothetical protein
VVWQQQFLKPCDNAGVIRKPNGLRHGFCTYHFAAYGNENVTAQQAGSAPAMVHQHYKGLATKAEAKKWFDVKPTRAANVIPVAASAKKWATAKRNMPGKLVEQDYDFSGVPNHELESCLFYEYMRESNQWLSKSTDLEWQPSQEAKRQGVKQPRQRN